MLACPAGLELNDLYLQDNILINDCGSAVIIDFGLSRSMAEAVSALISSRRGAGNVRWMAPELVDGSDPKSPEADVYSFACLAFHVSVHFYQAHPWY